VLLADAETYYNVVAAQGVLEAAERALATAVENEDLVRAQLEAGTATELALATAQVDTSRTRRRIAEARQPLALSRRPHPTLTGLPAPPANAPPPPPGDPTPTEEELVELALAQRPEMAEVRSALSQAEAGRLEAWSGVLPVLSAFARESYANAQGFLGQNFYWTLGGQLAWTVDPFLTSGSVRLAQAQVAEQRTRIAQVTDSLRDEVHGSWLQVGRNRAEMEAAEVEVESARKALRIARIRVREGAATVYELSQAQRDAFQAEASLVKARADLANALFALRRAAGIPLAEREGGG